LRAQAAYVFDVWARRLTELLIGAGLHDADATALAWMMIAATEGAVVLARAQRSMAPLDIVHDQLTRLADGYRSRASAPGRARTDT
jgi:TetR/AcrR family transcriptional regulator, lmrAB and yxaGH operons repressor